ncbi:MAG: S-adenosyl-l-methionine hydroxide adenosyltransferase family protein [Anaerolineaceae bacterium]
MAIISLLTDFGLRDGYVGVMKGVIWRINPEAQIADITHFILPQNIRQGALALERTTKYFPRGTVHIAVVDPGVGTNRNPMAAEMDGHFFVGPDNGLFSLVFQAAEKRGIHGKYITLDRPEFWLPEISNVFHGRDIFAPVGAHLTLGVPINQMGTPLLDPVNLTLPEPKKQISSWLGEVIEIDNFGNLATNIRRDQIPMDVRVTVQICGQMIDGLIRTFEDKPAGELIATIGTENDLMVAVVKGSAADRLKARIGDAVEVRFGGGKD